MCSRNGAVFDVGNLVLPLPLDSYDGAVEAIVQATVDQIQPGTKMVILDETTSNTAINMPVAALAAAVREVAGVSAERSATVNRH